MICVCMICSIPFQAEYNRPIQQTINGSGHVCPACNLGRDSYKTQQERGDAKP